MKQIIITNKFARIVVFKLSDWYIYLTLYIIININIISLINLIYIK